NAMRASTWRTPPQISHSKVAITPAHNKSEILPIVVIRRYSRITSKITSPPATAFASHLERGRRKPTYRVNPMEAEAIDNGACTNVCHTNKNDINRPQRIGPYASRKKTYEPPALGIAAPSSDHTNPSRVANTAPASQASNACGPPIFWLTIPLTTNGPIPTISIMLSAPASLTPC